jgi:alpha-glucoside transport system substrate-binding protein
VVSTKRTIAVVAVAASALLSVAACSSSSKSSNNSTGSTSGASSSTGGGGTATGSFKGQSFTILGQWTGGEQAAFQAVVDNFDKQSGASGKYTPAAGGNLSGVLGTQVAGGTPPDIAMLSLPGDIAKYAAAGKLKALSSATQAAVASNYATEWATLGAYKGTDYGVPVDASDKSTIWYNNTLFQQAGITTPPASWTDFIKDGQTLSSAGISVPISVGGGDGWTLTDWFENVYIRTAGVDMYDKLTHHQIPWTDPSVATALTTLKQVWGDTSLIGSPSKAAATTFTASVDNVFKASPTSAIVYEASFVATTITSDKDPATVGTVAKVAPFPSINGSAPVLEAAGDFGVAFSDKPVVQAFLAYLAGAEAAKTLVSTSGSGFLTANKQMANSAYPDATSAQLGQQLVSVGNNFRFDMSDQAPATFGGTPNKGEWGDLQTFLKTGDVAGAQKQLEADAKAAGPFN